VLELVKLPPPRGEEERPDDELADPVLALSKEEADEVAEETPEEDPMPEDPKPPCDPNVSSPWSLLASPHKARAPFNESIEGVGDVISPDFCLTMPRLTGPDKVADPRSPMLDSHTFLGEYRVVSSCCGRGFNLSAMSLWCSESMSEASLERSSFLISDGPPGRNLVFNNQ